MSQPYVGEIRLFAGNFAPLGWMFCEGQTLAIADNDVLFNLIGTTYGGDGQNTFNLPDLRGRIPIHQGVNNFGTNYVIGQLSGTESVTLSTQQMPIHSHVLAASSSPGLVADPSNAYVAADRDFAAFDGTLPSVPMASGAVTTAGTGLPHNNMPPYLCVSFIISLFGIFPSQA
jgi:microcystin-dependent protein